MSTTPWAPPGGHALAVPPSSVPAPAAHAPMPPTTAFVLDDGSSSTSPPDGSARDERGLVRIGWLKLVWLVAQLAAVPVAVVSPVGGTAVATVALVAMMTWSGAAAANAERARPRTVYSSAPRPFTAVASWLAPLVVVSVALVVAWWLIERTSVASDLTGDARRDRIITVVAVVSVLPFAIALYRPYSVMGRVTAWVGGARRRWQHFFWLPLLASVLVSLVQWIFLITAGLDAEDGRLGFVGTASIGVFLGLIALPSVLTLWLGWTAMAETERASRMTWERRNFPEGSLDLSDEFVARAAVAAYLASHPDG